MNDDIMRGFQHLGDLSAVDPQYRRGMVCYECRVTWDGCWDNFQCPKCGHGDLPRHSVAKATPDAPAGGSHAPK